MPHRKSLSMMWRRIPERYRLEGTKCLTCDRYFFPPRSFCPDCRRKGKIEKVMLTGRGKVYSYTVVHVPLEGFERYTPYILAIIELEEGPKITAQVVDIEPEDMRIGMTVEAHFRRISEDGESGIIHYGFKFSPVTA